jgi:hypothetical protein
MMQNDAGQVVPIGASSTSSTPVTPTSSTPSLGAVAKAALTAVNPFSGAFGLPDLEDTIFVVLGLLLIAAGLFAFKGTQTIIQRGASVASKVGKASAEVAA